MHAPASPRTLTVEPVRVVQRAKPNRCVVCGKGTNRQQKYCSQACKSPSSLIPVYCATCGKTLPWHGNTTNRKYCNKACYGRSCRKTLTVAGATREVSEWAKGAGCAYNTIQQRLERGWTLEQAVTIPATGTHRKVNVQPR